MASRLKLHEELCEILGNRNVYFQPPESVKLIFPCIIYKLNDVDETFANDGKYIQKKGYQITIVDKDPDSELPDKVSQLQYTSFERKFETDNLNHTIYNIYY